MLQHGYEFKKWKELRWMCRMYIYHSFDMIIKLNTVTILIIMWFK